MASQDDRQPARLRCPRPVAYRAAYSYWFSRVGLFDRRPDPANYGLTEAEATAIQRSVIIELSTGGQS